MHDVGTYGWLWALPFAGLILTIAVAPLMLRHHWERHYAIIAVGWVLIFVVADTIAFGAAAAAARIVAVALLEYLPFILLVGTLHVVTGGIHVHGTPRGTPAINTALLAVGTALASIIGTPGAGLLLVRPLLRANRHRRHTRHVFVFFIFLVCNVGGALSPLGDPPLLLGYLRGVPFFWPTTHLALPTLTLAAGLLAIFYGLDRYLREREGGPQTAPLAGRGPLGIEGRTNVALLGAAGVAILLRAFWHTDAAVAVMGTRWGAADIAADALLAAAALLSLALTPAAIRRANEFAWAPVVEVAVLFGAIFITVIPVTAIMAAGASGPAAPLIERMVIDGRPDNALFYHVTGVLSAFVDNAPTYLVFFGLAGGDPARLAGPLSGTLAAISAGACYFGGLSYIGNAPNLLVKTIVESNGIRMPGFFGYIAWAAVCLLPWLVVVEFLFIR